MRKSVNSRLDYIRHNNESPALALRSKLTLQDIRNSQLEDSSDSKMDVDFPKVVDDWPVPGQNCICHRQSQTLMCTVCQLFAYGRPVLMCPAHKNVSRTFYFFR